MKSIEQTRYTGLFPQRIAVGLANTEPTPIPIIKRPVVSETRAVGMPKSLATLENPAASTGVMPPPIMQYSPSESRAASRRHVGQLSGSLAESSGCGSKMICSSAVFFLPSPWSLLSTSGFMRSGASPTGSDECDVLPGALRKPSGSFLWFDKSNTEPTNILVFDVQQPCVR